MKLAKLLKFSLVASLIFFPLVGEAAAKKKKKTFYCPTPSSIASQVEECDDNEYYAEAAVICLERLENEIQSATKALDAGLKRGSDRQSRNFNYSGTNYQLSESTLNELISMAKKMASEVDDYLGNLALPEDADSPEVTGGDLEGFLAEAQCFQEREEVIKWVLGDFDNHIKSLEAARDVASLNKLDSNISEAQIVNEKESASDQVVKSSALKKRAPAKVNTKSTSNPKSKITGIEEDRKKREQLE